MNPEALIAPTGSALAGACLASFAATAAGRIARGAPWVRGRSQCEACGVAVGYVASAPIAGWVALGGRCGACRAAIPLEHPLAEIGGALGFAVAATLPDVRCGALAALMTLLAIGVAVYDGRTRRIPDGLSLAVGLCGLALSLLRGGDALLGCLLAAIGVMAVLLACRFAFSLVRRDPGLGLGDVKLLGAGALWLGAGVFPALALAAFGGLAWARARRLGRADRLAFGPFLAASIVLVGLAEEVMWARM